MTKLMFVGLSVVVLLAVGPLSAYAAVCGDGVPEGGEECDPGGQLYVNGDPANATCITGNDCFYQYSCCKFNCQFVGEGPLCNDNDACTTGDQCDQLGNCVAAGSSPDQTACDDGVYCNGADSCVAGACSVHAGDPCSGTECNTCQEGANSCFDPASTPCANNDGNDCTTGTCDGAGTCAVTPVEGPCDDGLFCNGDDTCSAGACTVHAGDPCTGAECNTCQEDVDSCFDPAATACTDDGNSCTDDACDGAGSCAHPNNSASCDDGLFCNGADTCSGGSCSTHAGDPCGDGVSCTVDSCDEPGDSCSNTPDDALCDDTLYCNGAETCDAALDCQAGSSPCDDGEPCTDDTCDEGADSCSHNPLAEFAACEDGDVCTINDECVGGTCVGSDPEIGDLCPWTMVLREESKENKIKTGFQSEVGGDICGEVVMIGSQSVNVSDVVAVAATGKRGLAIGADAVIGDDIVSGGAGAKGKPGTVKLPYTTVTKLAAGSLTAKDPGPGSYDLTGTHALVADCNLARNSYDSLATFIQGLGATQVFGKIKIGREETFTITADTPGGTSVVDIEQLRAVRQATLELDGAGDPDSAVILRVSGKFETKLLASVTLSNGLLSDHVLIYSAGKTCKLGDKSAGAGTLLCAVGKLKVGKSAAWDGMLLAGRKTLKLGDGATVTRQPFVAF